MLLCGYDLLFFFFFYSIEELPLDIGHVATSLRLMYTIGFPLSRLNWDVVGIGGVGAQSRAQHVINSKIEQTIS
jgi:hypothetical protein